MTKKHWLNFLPEAGRRVKKRGWEQECKMMEIEALEDKLKVLKMEYKEGEQMLTSWVKDEWSNSEIKQAKQQAKNQI